MTQEVAIMVAVRPSMEAIKLRTDSRINLNLLLELSKLDYSMHVQCVFQLM